MVDFFKKNSYFLGIAISLAYFLVLLFTLKDYGINSDSPFHFMRGQALFQKLTTGKDFFDQPSSLASPVLFYPGERISLNDNGLSAHEEEGALRKKIESFDGGPSLQEQFKIYQKQVGRQSFYKNNAWGPTHFVYDEAPGHPPTSDILSAITNIIFYEKLGLLGDIEAYHLYAVLTAVFAVFIVYLFVASVWGIPEAILASFTLALYPFFFAESHFNIKDIPELAFFAASVFSFYFWVEKGKKRWFAAFLVSFFVAFSTKFNVLFLPLIVIPWLFLIRKEPFFKRWFTKKLAWYLTIFIVIEAFFFILLWPWLWGNTFFRILGVLGFYKNTGFFSKDIPSTLSFLTKINPTGIIYVFTTTPLIGVIFMISGLFLAVKQFRSKNGHVFALIFLWLLIPILRVLWPGALVFTSLRQFAEVTVPIAILIGVGGVYLSSYLSKILKLNSIYLIVLVFLAYFVYLIWITVSYHPNQNAFFNSLIGGPKGAEEKGYFLAWPWQGSFDNPYKQGIDWLNQHAEKNAKLAFLEGTMTAISPLQLRKDIRIGSYFSGAAQKGEYIISIYDVNPPTDFSYWYLNKFVNPIHVIKVKGAPFVNIWKNDPKFLKGKYEKQKTK